MSARLDVAEFQARAGQEFRMDLGGGQELRLELAAVRDLGRRSDPSGELSTYALVFRSPGERRHAPQGTYRLTHAELGALEVFVVPIGPDAVGMRYEAVFN